jgi:hypothetical protein
LANAACNAKYHASAAAAAIAEDTGQDGTINCCAGDTTAAGRFLPLLLLLLLLLRQCAYLDKGVVLAVALQAQQSEGACA